jgi:dipeptidyl aminopeptidase/acylaminoacyl peptidase
MKDIEMDREIKNIKLLWISKYPVIFFILLLSACPLWGQVGQRALEKKDYGLWETALPHKISIDGKWTSYGIRDSEEKYDMLVQNISTGEKLRVPNCYKHTFSGDGKWFVALNSDSLFVKMNLEKRIKEESSKISNFQISKDSKWLAYLKKISSNTSTLFLENLKNGSNEKFEMVNSYEISPNAAYLALVKKDLDGYKLSIINLNTKKRLNVYRLNNSISKILWSPDSKGIAFFEKLENGNNEVYWWVDIKDSGSLMKFGTTSKNLFFNETAHTQPMFSANGKMLFFQTNVKADIERAFASGVPTEVEIWNSKDEFLHPAFENYTKNLNNTSLTVAWARDKWQHIGTPEANRIVFGDGNRFVYTYSFKETIMAAVDKDVPSQIFVTDLLTGKRKPVLERITKTEYKVSPSGRYLAYVQNGNWNIYDAEKDTHTDITSHLGISFVDTLLNKEIPNSAYGNPGWTKNEKEIILYDEYDVWAISPTASTIKRLTTGRETNTKYRIHNFTNDFYENIPFGTMHAGYSFDLSEGIILNIQNNDDGSTGYAFYTLKNGMYKIVQKDALISNLRLSEDGNSIVYTEEQYDHPRTIYSQHLDGKERKVLYQSNPQHFDYRWGNEELVHFNTPNGTALKGILYYPANFDQKKKYPMIVSCYEIQSDGLYTYYNPSEYDSTGFNIPNFTNQGYFIFLPDILYKIGDTGLSAVECMIAGVEKVKKYSFIDGAKIGLQGHSFGGYESMFAITQTDIFATAVAGAGSSNLLSFYFSMAWVWHRPQSWRFEKQQWRMGDTYFNNPKAYNNNSPILNAPNITTPLLSWAGKLDGNVNWEQTLEFFLALRKLDKENIMLLYPNEGHYMGNPKNQLDLTHKLEDWFNFYLKDAPAAPWMKKVH